jgi:hypothetical protein
MKNKVQFISTYFKSPDAARAEELYLVLKTNRENLLMDYTFCWQKEEKPTYWDLISRIDPKYPVNIIANGDIIIPEETCRMLLEFSKRDDAHKHVFALSRWDRVNGEDRLHADHGSQDTWVFFNTRKAHCKAELDELTEISISSFFHNKSLLGIQANDVKLGTPGCDNRIAFILRTSLGLKLSNPAYTLKTIHLHESGVRTYTRKEVVTGWHTLVSLTTLENIEMCQHTDRLYEGD